MLRCKDYFLALISTILSIFFLSLCHSTHSYMINLHPTLCLVQNNIFKIRFNRANNIGILAIDAVKSF